MRDGLERLTVRLEHSLGDFLTTHEQSDQARIRRGRIRNAPDDELHLLAGSLQSRGNAEPDQSFFGAIRLHARRPIPFDDPLACAVVQEPAHETRRADAKVNAIRPNLARGCRPTGLDQLWVADITYVRLAEDFVYLAVVLDAFSRKVVGWALANNLEASLALQALDQALAARNPAPNSLIHHSDRGVQYACTDYVERLEARRVVISMSRPGNPHDNAKAESFMKTLKTEEVNGKAYANIEDARRQIGAFIDTVYNRQRLHSALDYKPPVEFEAELRSVAPTPNQDQATSLN